MQMLHYSSSCLSTERTTTDAELTLCKCYTRLLSTDAPQKTKDSTEYI